MRVWELEKALEWIDPSAQIEVRMPEQTAREIVAVTQDPDGTIILEAGEI